MAEMVVHSKVAKGTKRLRTALQKANRRNFSSIEDRRNSVRKIQRLVSDAVRNAAEENRRYGLSSIVIRDNKVYEVDMNRDERVIGLVKEGQRKYKAGQVLYARVRKD